MESYRLEGNIPSELVGKLMSRLCERHPLHGKTIVVRGLTAPLILCGWIYQQYIYPAIDDEIPIEINFGTPENPAPLYTALVYVAHNYGHALQFYRDGLKYTIHNGKKLECAAGAFARAELKAMRQAGYDLPCEQDKAKKLTVLTH